MIIHRFNTNAACKSVRRKLMIVNVNAYVQRISLLLLLYEFDRHSNASAECTDIREG